MRRLVVLPALVLCAAGCGGGAKQIMVPTTAILTDVRARADSISFDFGSAPFTVTASYHRGSPAQCGSGARVRLPGSAALVVHFTPAMTSGVERRILVGGGPVLELAKFCDFEADVGWAIGLDKRRPFHLSRQGATVSIDFR
ncbi:MAG TPA: hypothetical protein VGH82_11655 [Gaiellaceae bacterium]